MPLKLAKQAGQAHYQTYSGNFMMNNNITVNTPAQTHFSVEGVQLYTPQEIKAMKEKEERIGANKKEGKFVEVKTYKVSDDVNYDLEHLVKEVEEKVGTNKGGEKFVKKVNVKDRVKNGNKELVKMEKQMLKRSNLQEKLHKLAKKYQDLTESEVKQNKSKAKIKGKVQQKPKEEEASQQAEDDLDFEEDFDEGVECMPVNFKATKKSEELDDSTQMNQDFEEIEMDSPATKHKTEHSKKSFSERLGSAVHLLFS